jgi:hypothetical protein
VSVVAETTRASEFAFLYATVAVAETVPAVTVIVFVPTVVAVTEKSTRPVEVG